MHSRAIVGLGELAQAAGTLKRVRRKGWVDRGVADVESVADHSYRLAVLAWAVARARGLDAARATAIALLHDLAEAATGDETPFDRLIAEASSAGTSLPRERFDVAPPSDPEWRAAKHRRERDEIARLGGALDLSIGEELVALWSEYAEQASPEARLVKELDRVETVLQAAEYRREQPDLPTGSFRDELRRHPPGEDLAQLTETPIE